MNVEIEKYEIGNSPIFKNEKVYFFQNDSLISLNIETNEFYLIYKNDHLTMINMILQENIIIINTNTNFYLIYDIEIGKIERFFYPKEIFANNTENYMDGIMFINNGNKLIQTLSQDNQTIIQLYNLNNDKIWKKKLPPSRIEFQNLDSFILYPYSNSNKITSICIKSGKILWEFKADFIDANFIGTTYLSNDKNKIILNTDNNKVACLDYFNGRLLWKLNLKCFNIKKINCEDVYYSINALHVSIFKVNGEIIKKIENTQWIDMSKNIEFWRIENGFSYADKLNFYLFSTKGCIYIINKESLNIDFVLNINYENTLLLPIYVYNKYLIIITNDFKLFKFLLPVSK
jgi:outer membrane protein assembly factor BamB